MIRYWARILFVSAIVLVLVGQLVVGELAQATMSYRSSLAEAIRHYELQLYLLPGAALVAWFAARFAPRLLRSSWLVGIAGLLCLTLPLFVGDVSDGARRMISIFGYYGYDGEANYAWYPGYWAILLLVPALVHLSDRLRTTGRLSFAIGHGVLVLMSLRLMLLQPNFPLAYLFWIAAAFTVWLARPRGINLVVLLSALLVVPLYFVFHSLSSYYAMERVFISFMPWSDRFNHGFEWQMLRDGWQRADWWGTGTLIHPYPSGAVFLPAAMGGKFALNTLAQLYGWSTAAAVILLLGLQGMALWKLAEQAHDDDPLSRWIGQSYALMFLVIAGMSAARATGYVPLPSYILPWVGYDLNTLIALSWLGGTVVGFSRIAQMPLHGTALNARLEGWFVQSAAVARRELTRFCAWLIAQSNDGTGKENPVTGTVTTGLVGQIQPLSTLRDSQKSQASLTGISDASGQSLQSKSARGG